jgi:hypothetical protein
MFEHLDPNSRVWIYTADRQLNSDDKQLIDAAMADFMPQWAAHGNALFGDYLIAQDRFLILAVDESKAGASGCSIDTSVRFIKDLGLRLGVDFFDRMNLIIEDNGVQSSVHLSELTNYPEASVYNPMITSLSELRNHWKIRVADSPFI